MNKRLIKRIVAVRTRVRDVQVGEHTLAQAAEQRAHAARAGAEATLRTCIDDGGEELMRRREPQALWRWRMDLDAGQERCQAARAAEQAAAGVTELARAELRRRERELRTVETALERLRALDERRESRREATMLDDRAAAMSTRRRDA